MPSQSPPSDRLLPSYGRGRLRGYWWAAAAVAVAGAVAAAVEKELPLPNLSLIFLSAVLVVAARFGTGPALFASVLGLAAYNFFFTVPYYTFFVHDRSDLLTLLFFILVAVLTGNLAGRLRNQLEAARQNAARTESLYAFTRGLADIREREAILDYVARHVATTFGGRASIFLIPDSGSGPPRLAATHPPDRAASAEETAAAERAWRTGEPVVFAGGARAVPASLCVPMATGERTVGAIGVLPSGDRDPRDAGLLEWLAALARQAALALERARLAVDVEKARMVSESERLRAALLSSVSHDLRTPLASVIGSATALASLDGTLSRADRRELTDAILGESNRLNRLVQNLLDMTRISHGGVQPRRDWVDLREIVGRAVFAMREPLAPFRLGVAIEDDVPLLYLDPVLMEQVFVNILDNATKHAPAGSRIAVSARRRGDDAEIRVEDQGPGIPSADRAKVFEMFHRAVPDGPAAGTGLGLSICKGFVEAHGGRIAAESASDGTGAAIVISMPAGRTPAPVPD